MGPIALLSKPAPSSHTIVARCYDQGEASLIQAHPWIGVVSSLYGV